MLIDATGLSEKPIDPFITSFLNAGDASLLLCSLMHKIECTAAHLFQNLTDQH